MSDIVFILGAGASRDCGGPLMGDFLDRSSDLLRAGKVNEYREHFDFVFKTISGLQIVHSKAELDLQNIESVFTAFELANVIQCLPGSTPSEYSKDTAKAIKSLKQLIAATLEQSINFPYNASGCILPPPTYAGFAQLLKKIRHDSATSNNVSVITFNYDIAVDVAITRAMCGPNYCLNRSEEDRSRIDLLKLHGSLNWARVVEQGSKKSEKTIWSIPMEQYLRQFHYQNGFESGFGQVKISRQFDLFFDAKSKNLSIDDEPVIVPPTWNKADYHSSLTSVWATAAQRLSRASQIFVIGYSLPETDAFFKLLFALGSVGPTPIRRFAVFNPEPKNGGVDTRFRNLLGSGARSRYEYHQMVFSEAIDSLFVDFGGNVQESNGFAMIG